MILNCIEEFVQKCIIVFHTEITNTIEGEMNDDMKLNRVKTIERMVVDVGSSCSVNRRVTCVFDQGKTRERERRRRRRRKRHFSFRRERERERSLFLVEKKKAKTRDDSGAEKRNRRQIEREEEKNDDVDDDDDQEGCLTIPRQETNECVQWRQGKPHKCTWRVVSQRESEQ